MEGKGCNFSEIRLAIDKFKYISFDLFDTLIKRDCWQPTELFRLFEKNINEKYHINSHFAEKRIQAEKVARKAAKTEEVTLEEIYNYLQCDFDIIQNYDILKEEERYEYTFCQINPIIKPIYDYCISTHKKIVIITDIYLSEDLIKNILKKVGIHYDALFVSSSLKLTKAKGSLFLFALQKLGVCPSDILHIGDNIRSDYRIPKSLGVHSIHIDRNQSINLYVNRTKYKHFPSYANLCAFINNHASYHSWNTHRLDEEKNFFYQTGYEIQGPVLWGFIQWLQAELKRNHIKKVFFLARDGQIMQKAYKKLNGCIPNEYMFASRKALIIPTIWMAPDLKSIKEMMFWNKTGSISTFLKNVGLSSNNYADDINEYGFSANRDYVYSDLWKDQNFNDFYNKILKPAVIKKSKQEYTKLIDYLKQLRFPQRAAIVDIGWYGHMQAALQKVIQRSGLKIELHGFYLGLRPNSPILDTIQAQGYLFDRNKNSKNSPKEATFNSIVEVMFTADHGTTKGYQIVDDIVRPVLGKWEYGNELLENDYDCIKAAQNGALNFIEDMLQIEPELRLKYNAQDAFTNWLELGCKPSRISARYFGNLHMLEDNLCYLAKPKENFNYLFHVKEFANDFRHSLWLVGFLTRLYGSSSLWFSLYQFTHWFYKRLK